MMSTDSHSNKDSRPNSTATSTTVPFPPWDPPKSPLPPYRLAKIANALGVSTPVPAVHLSVPVKSRSCSESSSRSPSPSPSTSFCGIGLTLSKYLLHVIPPTYLPHELNDKPDLTPPPASANGYHPQFRRGSLVPLHPNLQSQLGAIAKEYALPSTAGMVLYLVSSSKLPQKRAIELGPEQSEEPGPRLSEDIWRHLWTRVIKKEKRDDNFLSPLIRPASPSSSSSSTPPGQLTALPSDTNARPFRPFLSTKDASQLRPVTPISPSPSTPSSSTVKSGPPSSRSNSVSEPDTPDTSSHSSSFQRDSQARANSLDLPGLDSSSVIPVLAKVEFDIDLRRAPWYDPWIRSRKMNHAKRAEVEGRVCIVNVKSEENESTEDAQKRRRISLLTGKQPLPASPPPSPAVPLTHEDEGQLQSTLEIPDDPAVDLLLDSESSFNPELELESESSQYSQLPDDDELEDKDSVSDSDESLAEETTAQFVAVSQRRDPLSDVFGTDEETWAEIRNDNVANGRRQRIQNPNVVELALTAEELAAILPSPTQSEFEFFRDGVIDDVDEVQALLDQANVRWESQSGHNSLTGGKKHAPPPLILVPGPDRGQNIVMIAEPSPSPTPTSACSTANLAYLGDEDDDNDLVSGLRSPVKVEKREGAVYDDLDLGLDASEEYDPNDPHDRRRSQYLLKAKLDQIEFTMAQLSPRELTMDLPSPPDYTGSALSPNTLPVLSPQEVSDKQQPSCVGGSAATEFAVNDVSSSTSPLNASPPIHSTNGVPHESVSQLPVKVHPIPSFDDPDSPILPLSPDPFGPSSLRNGGSSVYWTEPPEQPLSTQATYPLVVEENKLREKEVPSDPVGKETSRFSTDLEDESPNVTSSASATLSAVSSLKRLWKRTSSRNSAAPNNANTLPSAGPTPTPTQTQTSPKRISTSTRAAAQRAPTPTTPMPSVARTPTPNQTMQRPSQEQQQQPHAMLNPHIIPSHHSPPPLGPIPGQQFAMLPGPQIPRQFPIPVSQQVPTFNREGRSTNPQPIRAAQMQPQGQDKTALGNLQFDQESPYPVRRAPSFPPRPEMAPPMTSPTSFPVPNAAAQMSPMSPLPDLPNPYMSPPASATTAALPELLQQSPSPKSSGMGPKSILKSWKSSISSSTSVSPGGERKLSIDKTPKDVRMRRPSIMGMGMGMGFGSGLSLSRASVVSSSSPVDLPPSPQIPDKYLVESRQMQQKSRLIPPGTLQAQDDVAVSGQLLHRQQLPPPTPIQMQENGIHTQPRPSLSSSRSRSQDSQETRNSDLSIDTSQFEIVSPKMSPGAIQ